MTNQELFNRLALHLLQQAGPSTLNGRGGSFFLSHWGQRGSKSPVGLLIPNSLYDIRIEGTSLRDIQENPCNMGGILLKDALNAAGVSHTNPVLVEMQSIHDGHGLTGSWVEYIRRQLPKAAEKLGLSTAAVL